MYDEIHCPLCGSTEIFEDEERFNYKSGFWGSFIGDIGLGFLFGMFGSKNIEYHCQECGCNFIIKQYDRENS